MSKIVEANNSLPVARNAGGMSIMPNTFAEVMRFAQAMSIAGTAIPKHLRNNEGACMAIAMQAFEWGMSPFAVANKSYSVSDRISYEAQLIAAVVNTRSGIQGRLKYEFQGKGGDLQCRVTGIIDGETLTYTSPKFSEIGTKNSPLWKHDPEQQLGYYSARAWARRHVPEVILGVYSRDEIEEMEAPEEVPAAPMQSVVLETVKDEDFIEAPSPNHEAETSNKYSPFDTLGSYLEELKDAFESAKDGDQVQELWDEFDPMATLDGDESSQDIASSIKEKALDRIANDETIDFGD